MGYRLHELPNDITRETMACFEPTIDYVVTKVPRFAFEKFPEADPALTTQMKSVGETMAIGRTFKESFQKALRGLEVGSFGFGCDGKDLWGTPEQPAIDDVRAKLATPSDAARLVPPLRHQVRHDARGNLRIDRHRSLVPGEPPGDRRDGGAAARGSAACEHCDDATLRRAKQFGFSDRQLATIWDATEMDVRAGAQAPRHRGHVQVGRHLRRRVRGLHALLLLDLRGRGRNAGEEARARGGS